MTESAGLLPFTTPIPVHDDTSDTHDASCDWPDARYEAIGRGSSSNWDVTHKLSGAPGVEKLLATGCAAYAVETRCEAAMSLDLATSNPGDHQVTRVRLDSDTTGKSDTRLWPGVLAVEDCELDTAGSSWGDGRVAVAKGRWLVRGAPMTAEQKDGSLLVFKSDQEMSLDAEVRITSNAYGRDTRYVVRAHPDRIAVLRAAGTPALMACWATALAMLANENDGHEISYDDSGVPCVEDSPLRDALCRQLQSQRVPLWNQREWDPMRVASMFVRWQPQPPEDDAGE